MNYVLDNLSLFPSFQVSLSCFPPSLPSLAVSPLPVCHPAWWRRPCRCLSPGWQRRGWPAGQSVASGCWSNEGQSPAPAHPSAWNDKRICGYRTLLFLTIILIGGVSEGFGKSGQWRGWGSEQRWLESYHQLSNFMGDYGKTGQKENDGCDLMLVTVCYWRVSLQHLPPPSCPSVWNHNKLDHQ